MIRYVIRCPRDTCGKEWPTKGNHIPVKCPICFKPLHTYTSEELVIETQIFREAAWISET